MIPQNTANEAEINNGKQCKTKIRMIEFFSGIGGMRYGVENALNFLHSTRDRNNNKDNNNNNSTNQFNPYTCPNSSSKNSPLSSCIAYEISQYANRTYALNFKDTTTPVSNQKNHPSRQTKTAEHRNDEFSVRTKLVEQLKPQDLDGIADIWTMSPPCQPFTTTRNAKQNDTTDKRTDGFKGIMTILRVISNKPRWIILENVKGFVGSDALNQWYECLRECGYTWKEYLLSPMQFGVPNHRTRYYMICELSDRFRREEEGEGECMFRSSCGGFGRNAASLSLQSFGGNSHSTDGNNKGQNILLSKQLPCCKGRLSSQNNEIQIKPLHHFLRAELNESEMETLRISDDVLKQKWANHIPVVSRYDRVTHCFTAAYGRQIHKATGSLLLSDNNVRNGIPISEKPMDRTDMTLYSGQLRRFAPQELLSLFGFPVWFRFPSDISLAHQYKLIGNSVSVFVVTRVAEELLQNYQFGL